MEETKSNKRVVLYVFYFALIVASVVLALWFPKRNVSDVTLYSINVVEGKNPISYRVFYKKNNFYSEPYIDQGKTYVAQYVDTIDADFDYYVNYSDIVDGAYAYDVKATLYVYEPGDESNNYWTKNYTILENQTKKINSVKDYHVIQNLKIDYNDYLKDYNEYKSNTILSTNAKVVITIGIRNEVTYDDEYPISYSRKLELNIPLSEAQFKITTNNDIPVSATTFEKKDENKKARDLANLISYTAWGLAGVLTLSLIFAYRADVLKDSPYERKLKKILSTYDSIIVNADRMPFVSDLSVVFVTSFEELVDAQNEVRLPINYKQDKKKRTATFILVRNNIAWVYQLRGKDEDAKK